ncbi:MAG: CHAT domain-containing protein [Planctomycetota bacterium]
MARATSAQGDALDRFKEEARAAIAAAQGGRPRDLREAARHLDAAEGQIGAMGDAHRQAQARLFLAVRRADLLFRAPEPNLQKARAAVEAARATARRASVWTGADQEAGLVILWQTMLPAEFFELVEGAPDDLALIEKGTDPASDNAVPLRLMRADLRLFQGRERAAVAEWAEVSALLRSPSAPRLGDAWWDKCHDALVWHLLEQRDYARAAVFVPLLRDAERRVYYEAMLANQRGDHARTEEMLVEATDPRAVLLLADAREQLGKLDEALANYQAVEKVSAAEDERRAAAQNGQGDCYRRRNAPGDLDRAAVCYERSLRSLADLSSRKVDAEVAENHCDLGLLAEQRRQPAAAYASYLRALAALERGRAGIPLDPFGAAFLERGFLRAVDGALRTWRASGASPLDALVAVDQGKARSLLDRVAAPRALEASPEVLEAVRTLARARDPAAAERARLALEEARAAVAERTLVVRPAPLDRDGVRACLAAEPGTLTLAYWVGSETAWLVAAQGADVRVFELGRAAEAEAKLRAAYEMVSMAPDGRDPWAVLDEVSAWFLPAPVRADLGAVARVVFCPDDRLVRLPFEAMRIDGSALGLTHDVERAPSLAVRAVLQGRDVEAKGSAALVVDSVPLTTEVARSFGVDELRFSAQEGDLVASAWPGALRLRGTDATLAALRDRAETHRVGLLHVSAHAVAHGVVPSASLLLLADGPVPLSSLAELRLEGATVVLSACASASGEARDGEGDAGLLWGPLGAGARCVVASLWAVNQQATCDLMGQMHHWLGRGEAMATALRRARVALAAAPNYAHPHYWAGFAVFGRRAARPTPLLAGVAGWGVAAGAGLAGLLLWRWSRRRSTRMPTLGLDGASA